MRIFLIEPCTWESTAKGFKISLGLAYLAAYLKGLGHEVGGLNLNYPFERVPLRYLKTDPQAMELIEGFRPDVVGFSCYSHTRHNVYHWARAVKERLPGVRVVLGGAHASFQYEEILRAREQVDFIIRGEGELAFAELMEHLAGARPASEVANLCWRESGEVRAATRQAAPLDLDELPFPDREYVHDAQAMLDCSVPIDLRYDLFPSPQVHVLTSRGCPVRCKFCCSSHFWGARVRFRSPRLVVEELKQIRNRWPDVRSLAFHDDTMTVKRSHVEEICQLMIDERLDMRWVAWTRMDAVRPETVRLMRRAGCVMLKSGMESGSQRVLDLLGKKVDVPLAREGVRIIEEEGVCGSYNFLLSYPGESGAEAMETVRFIRDNNIPAKEARMGMATVFFPGTELTEQYVGEVGRFDWDSPPPLVRREFVEDPAGNPLYPVRGLPVELQRAIRRAVRAPRLTEKDLSWPPEREDALPEWRDRNYPAIQDRQFALVRQLLDGLGARGGKALLIGDGSMDFSLAELARSRGVEIEHVGFDLEKYPGYRFPGPLPYADGTFSTVIARNMLVRAGWELLSREVARVLSPQGQAHFIEVNKAGWRTRLRFLLTGATFETFEDVWPIAFGLLKKRLGGFGLEFEVPAGAQLRGFYHLTARRPAPAGKETRVPGNG